MSLLFVVALTLSAPPSTPTLDALMEEPGASSTSAKTLVSRLEQVAKAAKAAGQSPRERFVQMSGWKTVGEMLRMSIKQVDPRVGESSAESLHELLLGAASMLKRKDLHELQAGLTTLGIAIQPLERLKWPSAERYKMAVAELVPVSDNKAREALVDWLSRHGGKASFDALLSAATTDKAAAVRAVAARGLSRCADKVCPIEPSTVKERMLAESDDLVRTHWVAIAGRLRMAEVFSWCKAQLGGGPLDLGCRTAMLRLGDERAFGVLYEWLVSYEGSKTSLRAKSGFGASLATLGAFARKPFVKGRILKLVDRALGRRGRAPSELVSVAGMLGYAKDKKRALRSAKKHRKAFQKKAGTDRQAQRVVDALTSTIQMLERN